MVTVVGVPLRVLYIRVLKQIFFFCGGDIEGAKCDSVGAKIQKFAESGLFWPSFLLTGGEVGGRASDWGKMPPIPPLMPPLGTLTRTLPLLSGSILHTVAAEYPQSTASKVLRLAIEPQGY